MPESNEAKVVAHMYEAQQQTLNQNAASDIANN